MDIINSVSLAPLSNQMATLAPVASAAPDAMAAARFAELMAQPADATAASNALQPLDRMSTQSVSQPPALDADSSVGDRILNGLQSVSGDFRTTWDSVSGVLNSTASASLNIQDMLKLQMQLVQTSFQYELVGKAISRSTQNLDQLVRIQ